ncbi:hypothetical protein Tco_1099201, partial [Tanacetum coccineum]
MTDAPTANVQETQETVDTHVIPHRGPITFLRSNIKVLLCHMALVLTSHPQYPDLAVFSIPDIVDAYLANKMHEAVKTIVQLQSKRLKDEAQAENADFLNKLDDNIKKIIRGSKRRRAGKEPESTSAPKEKTSKTTGKSTEGSKSHHKSAGEPAQMENPRESFDELMDTPLDFSAFVMNRLKVDTLTPELLTGLTFELVKGTCKSLVELQYFFEEVYKATTDQLDWINPEEYLSGVVSSRKYETSVMKTKAADYEHIKWIEDLVPNRMWSQVESARDVYSKRRIIAVTKLEIVEWHNYKHIDWITIRRDDDKLYEFKE